MAVRNGKLLNLNKRGELLLKENQYIDIKWNNANKKRFVSLGYTFTKIGDIFSVKADDLSPNSKEQIVAICDYCGNEYTTCYMSYWRSVNQFGSCCCIGCSRKRVYENNIEQRQEAIYNSLIDICDRRGYILLTQKEEIRTNNDLIQYICPKHGVQSQSPKYMKKGQQCRKCANEQNGIRCRKNKDDVVFAMEKDGNTLLNPEDYIDAHTQNLQVLCGRCGVNVFVTSWSLYNHGVRQCKHCGRVISKGEYKVRDVLDTNNVEYITEYRFKDCRDKYPLPFDFYLPKYNMCIEYDGEQHYIPWHEEQDLKDVQRRDNIKTNYCDENNIKLLRIPYWEKNNIEQIIKKELMIK